MENSIYHAIKICFVKDAEKRSTSMKVEQQYLREKMVCAATLAILWISLSYL